MAILFAKLVVSYLLGSISGSLLLGRWRGLDIRSHGSGNAGGTNAFRVAGWRFALGVIVIDVGKGALAAALGAWWPEFTPEIDLIAVQVGCAIAAVIGHCWPVFYGFRGGKGAGTLVGALLVLAPLFAMGMVVLWIAVIALTRFVGFATVLAALALPVMVLIANRFDNAQSFALLVFACFAALFITFTHRSNLIRMWRKEEPRIRRGATS
jgi:glycerol-3-phosphate acyltransferase PlsY